MPDFDTEIAKFHPRQLEAIRHLDSGKVKYLLYGGAMGGGKSRLLRWYGVRRLLWMKRNNWEKAVIMLACEDYPSLKDRQIQKISTEMEAHGIGKIHDDHKVYGRCLILPDDYGGGVLCFRNLDDPSKYMSSEWADILVDELTKNTYQVFNDLRNRLRWPGLPDVEAQFVAGTNPGGLGHGWVKMLWIDREFPIEFIEDENGVPNDQRGMFAFVPAKAEDNPNLPQSYWNTLLTLPEAMRKAYRDGSWDIYIGQAFPEFTRDRHMLHEPLPIPPHAQVYMTYDWGFGKPFSIGWWWIDGDGRAYRFWEWYGWNGTPNEGLRLPDSTVAQGIIQREACMDFGDFKVSLEGRRVMRIAGHDCFAARPNYRGGGQGPSTAEEFAKKGLLLSKGDPDRKAKIRQLRERLKPQDEGRLPMLVIYPNCNHFARTISTLPTDPINAEDVNCFVAGTKVQTVYGRVPIESISEGELVVTPIGPRKVTKAGQSGVSYTMAIELSDGTTLEGTPNHKIFVQNTGLLPLYRLSSKHQIPTEGETWIPCVSSTEESDSRSIQTDDILSAIRVIANYLARRSSIGLCGKTVTDLSRWDTTFITKITMDSTTPLRIWNSFLTLIMHDCTTRQDSTFRITLEHGEKATKVKKLFAKTLESAVKILPLDNLRALIVAYLLQRNIPRDSFVQTNVWNQDKEDQKSAQSAERLSYVSPIAPKKSKRVVTNVVGNLGKKPVYNLTVEQAHLFYANGILVTNTNAEDHVYDEACFLVMARPLVMRTPQGKKSGLDRRIERLERPVGYDDYERHALQEARYAMREIRSYGDFGQTMTPDGFGRPEADFDFRNTVM